MRKREIIKNLFWDYNIDVDQYMNMLKHPGKADQKAFRRFFVRAFESLRWHEFVSLFGGELVLKMDDDETRKIMRKEVRNRFDNICAVLRKEPVSVTRQDLENSKRTLRPLLSHRWYCIEQGISQA